MSLNRPSDVESPTGRFCCEVPDTTGTNQRLCVNIGMLHVILLSALLVLDKLFFVGGVSISIPSDTPVAGESYTLECSAGGSQADNFQWLKGPPDGRTPVVASGSITISSTSGNISQLQFRPVQQSDNGTYSCNATTNGLTLSSESVMINVNGIVFPHIIQYCMLHYYYFFFYFSAPPVSVQISDSGATPAAGESYQLNCSVPGAENLNPTTTYRWTRNSGSGQTQVGANSNTLSFTPLRLADAASYACEVTISSSYLTGDIVAMAINPQDIRIQSEF